MTDETDDSYRLIPSEYNVAMQHFITIGIRALMEAQGGPYSFASRESINQLPDYPNTNDQVSHGRLIEATFDTTVSTDEIVTGDFEAIIVSMSRIAIELEAQISREMIAHIANEIERAGNVVSGELSYDSIIETLERVDFSFDENGNPNLSFVAAPQAAQQIRDLGAPTTEQQRRFDEIIAKRRDERDARRRNRRLSSRRD
jgi:hypothetical protein